MTTLNAEMSFSIFVPSCMAVLLYELYGFDNKPSSSIFVLLCLEICAEAAVRLLYKFLEICATNQQSLLDFRAQK